MVSSNSQQAPLLVVLGATGNQGGSVVQAFLDSDKPYRIHAVTRSANSAAAQALSNKGVHVVEADILSGKGLDSAFEKADYVFGVINFATIGGVSQEVEAGKNIVDAAKRANIKLFLWSAYKSYKVTSQGKYDGVDHLDAFADVTDYANQQGLPTIVIQPGSYMTVMSKGLNAKKQPDGSYIIAMPFAPTYARPLLDIQRDYGLWVLAAVESGHYQPGSIIPTCGEMVSMEDMAKQLSAATGKQVKYIQVSDEQFVKGMTNAGLDPTRIRQNSQMLFTQRDYGGYYGGEDPLLELKHLIRQPHTFKDYLKTVDFSKTNYA